MSILISLAVFFTFSKNLFKLVSYLSLLVTSSVTILIFISLFTQTISFFRLVSPAEFFFCTTWEPNFTMLNGEITQAFGILPILLGTFLISSIAIFIAAPIGLLSAIFLTYFTSKKVKNIIKPLIEVMSGIPTVVYGYFALNFLSPLVKNFSNQFGVDISTESALLAGIVIGIMITPLIISLIDDTLHSIPRGLYYGAAALGSTQAEIISHIILPYSVYNIFSIFFLALSRAIGETMIVLMLTNVSAHLDFNPLHSISTITVQIVTILTGDQTFNSAESLSAYALGLTLFIMTWILNGFAIKLNKKSKQIN